MTEGRLAALSAKLDRDDDDDNAQASLAQVAWQAIREDILSGDLEPQCRLRVAMLRKKYKMGASPLREALSRLVSENLVVSLDRRGFMVSPISVAEFRDLTDLRKFLEREALRLSLLHGDERWESELVAAFYRLDKVQVRIDAGEESAMEEWEARNREYHDALTSGCPSRWLLRVREAVYTCAQRYRRICLANRQVPRDVKEEHEQIRDAALARDVQKLHFLIDEHLERTFEKVAASETITDVRIAPARLRVT